jgi:hypothetical protein
MFSDEIKRQSENEQVLAGIRDAIPEMTQSFPYLSKLFFEYFTSLRAAGFSEQQAIYLVGAHGTSFGINQGK